jgi:Glycosyl transferases group 1
MDDHGATAEGPSPWHVALVADPSGITRRLAQTLGQLAEHGVPGCELELAAGPETLAARHHDLLHAFTGGGAAAEALRIAREGGARTAASFDPQAPAGSYDHADLVLSPSATADAALETLGVPPQRIARWHTGVDVRTFHPARYAPDALPPAAGPTFDVLHIGPADRDLHEAFLLARDRDRRLRLVIAEEAAGTDALAATYASADLLLIGDPGDAFGDAVLEAHASGLPVLAVDAGAAAELIENGRTGCLVPPDPAALAAAIVGLARRATLLERLATGGLRATRARSWQGSLAALAGIYAHALAPEPVARAA